jgi:NADH-ubiquinone oxidoreductase chain 2
MLLFNMTAVFGGGVLMTDYDVWSNLLLISSVLSLFIGTVVGVVQVRVKRLLAYSSISHVGFMLLALSLPVGESLSAFIFYYAQYLITSTLSFSVLLAIGYMQLNQTRSLDLIYIKQLTGLYYTAPGLGLSMVVVLLSFAGMPPLIGFFAKQLVLMSAVSGDQVFVALIGIITSVISASYYLHLIRVTHFNVTAVDGSNMVTSQHSISSVHAYIIATLTVVVVLFMACPDLIFNTSRLVAYCTQSI